MYVLDISEDVAGLHAACPQPTRPGPGPGECFSQLVDRCVSHALSVVAPYQREEDRIQEWFHQMYVGSTWETAEWYLNMEARVLQPLLTKISHFLFSIVHKHPYRILEVETSRYEGRMGQPMHIKVQANIQYSDNEVIASFDDEEPPETSNDFNTVNSAALEDIQRWHKRDPLAISPIKMNPTLYSVAEQRPVSNVSQHWSDEPQEVVAARAQMQSYQETLGWVLDRLDQRVKEDRVGHVHGMHQAWVKQSF